MENEAIAALMESRCSAHRHRARRRDFRRIYHPRARGPCVYNDDPPERDLHRQARAMTNSAGANLFVIDFRAVELG